MNSQKLNEQSQFTLTTRVRQGMLKRLMRTFFDDSPEQLVASLLDDADRKLSSEEAERIRGLIVEHERRIKDKTNA